jgi:hypothetical protein
MKQIIPSPKTIKVSFDETSTISKDYEYPAP